MAGRIVTVAQQKGGAGKTTLAAQLAACWAGSGRRVALIDIDPQGSLTAWHGVRQEQNGVPPLHLSTVSGWRVAVEADRLRREYDVIVVDSPPHAETEAKAAVRAADLVLVPVQLSPMDLWATGATIDLAQRERRPLLLVVNRAPPRGKLADRIRAQIEARQVPLAGSPLGNRQAFAASLDQGKGVTETEPGSAAAAEMMALAEEVWSRLAS